MFKRNLIAVSLAFAAVASAQVSADVVGGGATLPQGVYQASGVFPAGFAEYIGVGSGAGKRAFFNNDSTELGLPAGITVDYAGSDSVVSDTEYQNYQQHATLGEASFGPLVQLPSAATSVTVPYKVAGRSSLPLTSQQLADIFAGNITDWSDSRLGLGLSGVRPITVVYRADGSGTTEIFLRHLQAVAPTVITGNLSNNFASMVTPPAGAIGVSGSSAIASTVAATEGAIGYVSPDYAEFGNAAKVATVNGKLPTEAEVQAALADTLPPTGTDAEDPRNWAPTFENTTVGYPIVGLTNLIFSQCYMDPLDNLRIRSFLNSHYTGGNDAVISQHSLIPLPSVWKDAVHDTFWNTNSSLRIGDTSTCNGKGRPL